ncbi:MAG: hypothetical protein KDA84_21370 [Planctomycetaceae bacterium]|nr:hypothetical protein [Planctomycetaceae bacterium]
MSTTPTPGSPMGTSPTPDSPMSTSPTPDTPMSTTPDSSAGNQSPLGDTNQSAPAPAQDFANAGAPGGGLSFGSAQGGLGSSDVAFSNAPSMVGDFFGTGSSTLIFQPAPVPTTFQQQTSTDITNINGMFRLASDPSIQANYVSSVGGMGNILLSQGATQPVSFGGVTVNSTGSFISQSALFTPTSTFGLNENSNVTSAVQAAYPGATITHVSSVASQDPANPGNIYFVTSNYQAVTTTTILVPGPGNTVILIPQSPIVVTIPSPSAGGFVVGRQKISENTSPMPRDRIFTNYSYFDNASLTARGVNVNRITPGFEKTFWDGNASFEARFPFATTLSPDIIADGVTSTDETEFGNFNMTLKVLTYKSEHFAWSNGLAMTLPTGDDMSVSLANGFQVAEVENDSVHLLPFTGFLWVPDNRLFVQGYFQADFDCNGNQVYVSDGTGRLIDGGIANDQTFVYADLGMGYWLYQDPTSRGLSGFAPIAELHYNRSVQSADIIQAGNVTLAGADDIQVLDTVVGATAKIGDRAFLTAAYAFPIGNSADKQFDGEARVTFNWFFGRSANSPFNYGILP